MKNRHEDDKNREPNNEHLRELAEAKREYDENRAAPEGEELVMRAYDCEREEADENSSYEALRYMGTDAVKWAEKFIETSQSLGFPKMPQEWLIGWFANAIEAGAMRERTHVERQRSAMMLAQGFLTGSQLKPAREALRQGLSGEPVSEADCLA